MAEIRIQVAVVGAGEEWKLPGIDGKGICVGASLCMSLRSMWSWPLPSESGSAADPQRSTVAAALCAVLAFSSSAKV